MNDIALNSPAFRFRQLWPAKIYVGLFHLVWVGVPYTATQYVDLFPATMMPQTAIDRAIPFSDTSIWIYLSMYVFMPLMLLMIAERYELSRYLWGIGAIGLLSCLVFFFFPTGVERPHDINEMHWLYRFIVTIDKPVNACPSLHASQCFYCAMLGHVMSKQLPRPTIWRIIIWVWLAAILYTTLSTRQHVFVDIFAGSALAITVWFGLNPVCRFPVRHAES